MHFNVKFTENFLPNSNHSESTNDKEKFLPLPLFPKNNLTPGKSGSLVKTFIISEHTT